MRMILLLNLLVASTVLAGEIDYESILEKRLAVAGSEAGKVRLGVFLLQKSNWNPCPSAKTSLLLDAARQPVAIDAQGELALPNDESLSEARLLIELPEGANCRLNLGLMHPAADTTLDARQLQALIADFDRADAALSWFGGKVKGIRLLLESSTKPVIYPEAAARELQPADEVLSIPRKALQRWPELRLELSAPPRRILALD